MHLENTSVLLNNNKGILMNCEMLEEERCVSTSLSSECYVVVHQAETSHCESRRLKGPSSFPNPVLRCLGSV